MRMIIGFVLGVLTVSAMAQKAPIDPGFNYLLAIAAKTISGNMTLINTDDRGYVICSDYRSPAQ